MMANKSYNKGRRKEYKIVHEYEDLGCRISQRTAGSHSPIDVLAVDEENNKIFFIQSKPDNFSRKKEKELKEKNKGLNGTFEAEFLVV